jgi:hypothetical protein
MESTVPSEGYHQTSARCEDLVEECGQAAMAIVRCECILFVIYANQLRFHANLPLLHFLADRKAFSSPTPLLLASILYISALHHNSAEYASIAPSYFAATCSAIAELVMPPATALVSSPGEPVEESSSQVEDQAFHNILGLIMASLSSEAFIETTGTWISIGYRLLLDHCPHQVQDTSHDWRGLFSGLQVCSYHFFF